MNRNPFRALASAAVASALLAAVPAAHAAATWSFSSSASPACTSNGNYLGNTWTCSASPTLSATAWSTTGSGGTYEVANLAQYGTSGFGVRNENEGTTSPNHSMDNDGARDLIMLNFGQATTLTQLRLGWMQNDSDLSVLAYTGSGAASIAGSTASALLGSGWSVVGNYANVGTSGWFSINGANVASDAWLISAYNPSFGGTFSTSSFDYIKLLAVEATQSNGVPEPGSLALAAVALIGACGARRRAGRPRAS